MTPPGRPHRRRLVALGAPVALMGAIFALSSVSMTDAPAAPVPHVDKLVHGLLYAALGALVARALVDGLGRGTPSWPAAALVAALYGGTDELHQRRVPGRTASWGDLAADAAGSLVGAAAWAARARRRQAAGQRGA